MQFPKENNSTQTLEEIYFKENFVQILPFTFNKSKIRTILDKNSNVWFIANDISTMLMYKRPSDAITQHCKNITTQNDFQKLHGDLPYSLDSRLKLIPESDMWRLIIKSKLPEAEKVENWIMETVLPSIRKTGSYQISKKAEPKTRDDLISVSNEEMRKEFDNLEFIFKTLNLSESEKITQINLVQKKINGIQIPVPTQKKHEQVFTITQLLEDFQIPNTTNLLLMNFSKLF